MNIQNLILLSLWPKNKSWGEICFIDDGITIPGSFRTHKIKFSQEYEAIFKAINGISTKSKERGYGLNTCIRIFTNGIAGEILIVLVRVLFI
jgi:hypothetical protein